MSCPCWDVLDILDEQPRSIFTPDYFKSEQGVMGGLTRQCPFALHIWTSLLLQFLFDR